MYVPGVFRLPLCESCVLAARDGHKRAADPPEVGNPQVAGSPEWVPSTKPISSVKSDSAPNLWAISEVPEDLS